MSQAPKYTVAVVSGEDTDVGKSTIIRQVLRPAMEKLYGHCDYLLVERTDRKVGEGETERFSPDDIPEVMTRCAKARAKKRGALLEFGGGQSEASISKVEEYKGSEGRIDCWVFPIRASQKADKVIEHITRLIAMGIPPEKLHVVVNFVPQGRTAADVIARDMPSLADHAKSYGYRILENGIPASDTIKRLREVFDNTVGTIARSGRDFAAEAEVLWAEDKDAEADKLSKLALLQMGSAGVVDALERVAGELLGADVSVALPV